MTNVKALFIDTNILIYANVANSPFHEKAHNALQIAAQTGRSLWISRQVIREFMAARTRPQTFAQPSTPEVITQRVQYLEEHFHVADDTAAITKQLLKLLNNYSIGGKQVHDTNIVATMLVYGISCLLTHNVDDFKRFENLITIEAL